MATGKDSFVLYKDLHEVVSKLKDAQAGILFKTILAYVNDLNPVVKDQTIDLVFTPIKQQLKRDLKKWEKGLDKKSDGGRIGNLKRWNPDLHEQVVKKEIGLDEAEKIALSRKTSHTDKSDSHTDEVKSDTDKKIAVPVSVIVPVSESVIEVKEPILADLKNPPAKVLTEYQLCVDYWTKVFHPGFDFKAVHGKSMKSIIERIKKRLKSANQEITPSSVQMSFMRICEKLPDWYKDKDLQKIDQGFNEIIEQIKNGKNGKSKDTIQQHFDAAEQAIELAVTRSQLDKK